MLRSEKTVPKMSLASSAEAGRSVVEGAPGAWVSDEEVGGSQVLA
jgi:hypothetical protein